MVEQQRHHEMDWLRIILILAVFLHHIGMPFNGDGFLIMNTDSSKLLDDIMVYFEQFRLPLLFLIAGAGSTLFLSRKRWQEYFKQRSMRLLLPLIVAMLLIIPPQNYFANIDQFDSYLSAFPTLVMYLSTNHLWFIEYLVVFALLSVPIHHFLKSVMGQRLLMAVERLSTKPWGIFLFVVLLMAIRVVFKLYFPEDSGSKSLTNPSSSLYYGFFYLMGMVLIGTNALWQSLARHRRLSLYLLIASSVIFYGVYFSPDLSPYLSLNVRWSIWRIVASLVAWSATLTILGYAQQYLTQNSPWLRKCNEMIYPFYIFHQTVIVAVGYYVIAWQSSITVKTLGLLVISLPLTIALCLVVYPFNLLRVMMGVKVRQVRGVGDTPRDGVRAQG
jgi:glucan biosynthesis protein C